jgi:acetyl esterase/lipase
MHLLLACTEDPADDAGTPATPEPIVLPDDPAENAAPVGVQTLDAGGQTAEVWYPATDAYVGVPTERADFAQFVPAAVTELIGEIPFPEVDGGAVRDADARVPEGDGYPIVMFSHGLGAMRIQSVDYATHLASRGYVVVAVDHPGRRFADLIPCLFTPALDGCDLSGFGATDPAVEDIGLLADWIVDGGLSAFQVDVARLALSGHSAGGYTTVTVGSEDERIAASFVMAAPGVPTRGERVVLGGTCDGVILPSDVRAAGPSGEVVMIEGAGHLAFSDMCELELLELAETLLAPREDVSDTFLDTFTDLASDGCPERSPDADACDDAAYLALATSDVIVRAYATAFFDAALYGRGSGIAGLSYPEAEVP